MTMRGFLAWYLGAVMVVGAAGASTYHVLLQRHAAAETAAAKPIAVADETPPEALPPIATPSGPGSAATKRWDEPSHVMREPRLRPHVAVATRPALRHPLRTVAAAHAAPHRPTVVATRREVPIYRPAPYAPSALRSPPAVGYYPYVAYDPYTGYYSYYPRTGYYRSF
jgi:hypothetical protein